MRWKLGSKEERTASSKQNRINAELVTVIPVNHQATAAAFCYAGTCRTPIDPSVHRGQQLCRISNSNTDFPTKTYSSSFLTACRHRYPTVTGEASEDKMNMGKYRYGFPGQCPTASARDKETIRSVILTFAACGISFPDSALQNPPCCLTEGISRFQARLRLV